MDDIEDIVAPIDASVTRVSTGTVNPKSFKKPQKPQKSTTFLPGQATVYVKTWGCGHNNSDGEYMAGMLATEGYGVVLESNKADEADVWVLNSCTVKGPSQQTFENDIQKGIDSGKKVIVAGCVPQGNQGGKLWQDLSVIGVQQIDKVVHVVEETLKGNTVRMLKESKEKDETGKKRKTGGAPLHLPKIRRNPFIEIIPINTGCLNQCTYCKTKHARGDLGSYHSEEIINRVRAILDEGVLEIWLTSEDTGAYGRDIGENIVDLLRGIVKVLEDHPSSVAMLRVGMTNPPYILEHLDGIAQVLNHPRVYSFLHVPVQAGSTKVLTDMKRLYTIEDFERVCDVLLEKVPDITLATDIICGFPTETESDFEETIRILKKYKFKVLHISQVSVGLT
jgi:threonylcarbamoyladenosine tRNA methylthiotransferase CDKAL1